MSGASEETLLKPGEVSIGFSTTKTTVSWLIRTATNSPASHSFLLYYSEQFQQNMVLEVQGRGFVQVPFEDWKKHNTLLALYKIDQEPGETANAMKELGQHLGAPYDTYSLIGFALIYVVRLWDQNDLDDKKKLVCSEMVALFLRWSNIPLRTKISKVVPRDLWRLAEDSESFHLTYSSAKAERKLPKVRKRGKRMLPHEGDRS